MTGPPSYRHELHRQNGNTQPEIAAAFLLLAFDKIDQEECWWHGDKPENDGVAVPMAVWSEIIETAKVVQRQGKKMPEAFLSFAQLLLSVPQGRLYDVRTQSVILPIRRTWAELLTARDATRATYWAEKAYATETFIRRGRFPGE
jgi:hypothetical protein